MASSSNNGGGDGVAVDSFEGVLDVVYGGLRGSAVRLGDGLAALDKMSTSFAEDVASVQRSHAKALRKVVDSHLPSKLLHSYPMDAPSATCTKIMVSLVNKEAERATAMAESLEAVRDSTVSVRTRLRQQLDDVKERLLEMKNGLEDEWSGVEALHKAYLSKGEELADTTALFFKQHMSMKEKARKKMSDKKDAIAEAKEVARVAYEDALKGLNQRIVFEFLDKRASIANSAEMMSAHLSRALASFFSKVHSSFMPKEQIARYINFSNRFAGAIGAIAVPGELAKVFAGSRREGPLPPPIAPKFDKKDRKLYRQRKKEAFESKFREAYGVSFEEERTQRREVRAQRRAAKSTGESFVITPSPVSMPHSHDVLGVTHFLSPFGNYAQFGFDVNAKAEESSASVVASALIVTLSDLVNMVRFHDADAFRDDDGSETDEDDDDAFFASLLATGLSSGTLPASIAQEAVSAVMAPPTVPPPSRRLSNIDPSDAKLIAIPKLPPATSAPPSPAGPAPGAAAAVVGGPAPPPRKRRPPRRPQSLILQAGTSVPGVSGAPSPNPPSPNPPNP